MANSDLTTLLKSRVNVEVQEDNRTFDELTAEVDLVRKSLAEGKIPTKDDLRTIVSYFRHYRQKASTEARAKAPRRRKQARKLTHEEEQNLIDNL